MRHARRFSYFVFSLIFCLLPARPLSAQTDIQTTVRVFLQSWYVDRKEPEQLKGYIAKDNGFSIGQGGAPAAPHLALDSNDPITQLFAGAFTRGVTGADSARPKTLDAAIEYPPARRPASRGQRNCLVTIEFAACTPAELPKGAVLPAEKPSVKDPIATYLWHLEQTYKNRLYVVLYVTKGASLLRETAILYWIQEDGSWKLAAFKGTNW